MTIEELFYLIGIILMLLIILSMVTTGVAMYFVYKKIQKLESKFSRMAVISTILNRPKMAITAATLAPTVGNLLFDLFMKRKRNT